MPLVSYLMIHRRWLATMRQSPSGGKRLAQLGKRASTVELTPHFKREFPESKNPESVS